MSGVQLEDIDPETGWSRAVIRLMAQAVSKARSRKAKSWALFSVDGTPRLNIGKRNVCEMYPDHIEFFINVRAVDRMGLSHLGVTTEAKPVRDFPEGGTMTFPRSATPDIVPRVQKIYLDTIYDLARLETLPRFRERHDEGLRSKLNEVGGVNITSPGYSGYKRLTA